MKTSAAFFLFSFLSIAPLWAQNAPSSNKQEVLMSRYGLNSPALVTKTSNKLLAVREGVAKGLSLKAAASKQTAAAMRGDKLQVILVVDDFSDDLLNAAAQAKLEIVGRYELAHGTRHLVVRCSSPAQLDSLLLRPDVKRAQEEPKRRTRAGTVVTQGDASMRAPQARSTYGVDGSGLRIGVISDSLNRTLGGTVLPAFGVGTVTGSTPQIANELPASIRVVDAGPTDLSEVIDEGSGMAEIIHDVAPGAALSFASAFKGYSDFATNITKLRTDPGFECDIIVDDVGYFAEPIFQNGFIGQAANAAFAAGVPYFAALGNDGDSAHEADYVDSNTGSADTAYPATGVDFHDFGLAKATASDKYLTFLLQPGDILSCILKWDDPGDGVFAPGPGSAADLDMYIVSNFTLPLTSSNILSEGIDAQGTVASPSGEPFEYAEYENTGTTARTVHVVIDHYDGRRPVHLHFSAWTDGTETDAALMRGRTAYGHTIAENAMGVAAIDYLEIDTNGLLQSPITQINAQTYSSEAGNSPLLLSDDGLTRLATPLARMKPDISAPDGANTSTFYPGADRSGDADSYPNFFGTSAAAPHAAAVAALMMQANPLMTASQVYSIMRTTAVDVETVGFDARTGPGLINAETAVGAANASGVADWQIY
ncbi:hypothetical protein CVU37_10580 [candidate division BRC1 bacterium HGW-BRC1-1]|jgi:hypothetical protein|nr:MAG: hypothetical protein CVU37_10580 [candidate division BRC1 bacterium HGW-BRC1-1]